MKVFKLPKTTLKYAVFLIAGASLLILFYWLYSLFFFFKINERMSLSLDNWTRLRIQTASKNVDNHIWFEAKTYVISPSYPNDLNLVLETEAKKSKIIFEEEMEGIDSIILDNERISKLKFNFSLESGSGEMTINAMSTILALEMIPNDHTEIYLMNSEGHIKGYIAKQNFFSPELYSFEPLIYPLIECKLPDAKDIPSIDMNLYSHNPIIELSCPEGTSINVAAETSGAFGKADSSIFHRSTARLVVELPTPPMWGQAVCKINFVNSATVSDGQETPSVIISPSGDPQKKSIKEILLAVSRMTVSQPEGQLKLGTATYNLDDLDLIQIEGDSLFISGKERIRVEGNVGSIVLNEKQLLRTRWGSIPASIQGALVGSFLGFLLTIIIPPLVRRLYKVKELSK